MSQGLFLVCRLIWGMQGRACRKESVGRGMGAGLLMVVRKSRVQIDEMKSLSAEMSKSGPVIIVVGIKKEKEKNSQKGKKRRERKGFPKIYDVVL